MLGAAAIAQSALLQPVRRRTDVTVAAVASRTNAAAYAATHGIPSSYGDYSALLEDAEIDLVYNALPPLLHAEWTIAALRAGKDVLCEKPFAMTAAEARRVRDAAAQTGRRAIEAFHDHYHPLSAWIRDTVGSGRLGRIHRAEAIFNGPNAFVERSLRHDPALGGGALMDLGCYPVHWLRALFGGPPAVRSASAVRNPQDADASMMAVLAFADGPVATLRCSMATDLPMRSALVCEGERGRLAVENIVFPSAGHSIHLELDGILWVSTVAGRTTYDHQLEALLEALQTGEPLPTEGEDPVANMATIDAIYAAAGFDRPWI